MSQSPAEAGRYDDIPDGELDRLAELCFDWIWLHSVWRTGPAAQRISPTNGFAIVAYG